MKVYAKNIFVFVCGTAAAAFFLVAAASLVSRPASALPAYAQQTGKACGFCHKSPGGGGPLTANGEKFKANGHKL